MFEGLYGNIQRKPVTRELKVQLVPLESYLNDSKDHFENNKVIESYVNELKKLLEYDSVLELIEGIHHLQAVTNKLQEKFLGFELPHFTDFYHELSPLLLQKYWERGKNEASQEPLEMIFLESIHIALEEEIYIWQEKIHQ